MALTSPIKWTMLSSVSKTKWIEVVVAPIAAQVSQLIILSEKAERSKIAIPDMLGVVNSVVDTCKNLESNAISSISTSNDVELKADMMQACEKLRSIGQNLLTAAHSLNRDPHSQLGLNNLVNNFRELLESVIKVLVTTDSSKVRQILIAANTLMQQVTGVEECDTEKGLISSLMNFTSTVKSLLELVNKRQKELISRNCRETLVRALKSMQENAVTLSRSKKAQISGADNENTKTNREYSAGQIRVACADIIRTVQRHDDSSNNENQPGEYIVCMNEIQRLLQEGFGPSIGSLNGELDLYVSGIIRASMNVARLGKDQAREEIVEQSQKLLHVRNELHDINSNMAREMFDMRSERLLVELQELMRIVKEVTIYRIVDILADTSSPIEMLLYDRRSGVPSNYIVPKNENNFQVAAERILEVGYCAALFADSICVQRIRTSTRALDKLTREVLTTSRMLRVNPSDRGLYTQLENVSNDWAERLKQLSAAIDKTIEATDFLRISELEIYKNIRQCQDALQRRDMDGLSKYASHAGKCLERAMGMARSVEMPVSDRKNHQIMNSLGAETELIVPELKITLSAVVSDMKDFGCQQQFLDITNRILEIMRALYATFTPSAAGGNPESILQRDLSPRYTDDSPRSIPDQNYASAMTNMESGYYSPPRRSHANDVQNQPPPRVSPTYSQSAAMRARGVNNREEDVEAGNWRASKSNLSRNEMIEHAYVYKNMISEIGDAEEVLVSASPRVFASPISRLVDAAVNGEDISGYCLLITDACKKMADLAQATLSYSKGQKDSSLVYQAIVDLQKLTPQVISVAQIAAINRNRRELTDQLRVRGQDWSFKMQVLAADIDKFIGGWSTPATRVAAAAHVSNIKVLDNQIDAFHAHVMKLGQITVSTIVAAEEELNLSLSDSFDVSVENHSKLIKRNISLMRQHTEQVNSALSLLISTAKTLYLHLSDDAPCEKFLIQLEILRREWGMEVKALMEAVDGVIKGTVAPVEALISAAQLGDRRAVHERAKTLNSYRNTLKEISITAISGCDEVKNIESLRSNMQSIERITNEIMDLAWISVETYGSVKSSREGLAHQATAEQLALLQREWAAKVHLMSAMVDNLTAEVSSPVDNLAGAAISISKSYGGSRGMQLLQSFQVQADTLTARIARVKKFASMAVANSRKEEHVRLIHITSNAVEKLTPKVITAARGLAENTDQLSVEWFQLIRRHWATKAFLLVYKLDRIEDADFKAVSATVQELFGIKPDTGSKSVPMTNNNIIQTPLPTYPMRDLPIARSTTALASINDPYGSYGNIMKPSVMAVSQPNLASLSLSMSALGRPYSALPQSYEQPRYSRPQSAFSPNPNSMPRNPIGNSLFSPSRSAIDNNTALTNSTGLILGNQRPMSATIDPDFISTVYNQPQRTLDSDNVNLRSKDNLNSYQVSNNDTNRQLGSESLASNVAKVTSVPVSSSVKAGQNNTHFASALLQPLTSSTFNVGDNQVTALSNHQYGRNSNTDRSTITVAKNDQNSFAPAKQQFPPMREPFSTTKNSLTKKESLFSTAFQLQDQINQWSEEGNYIVKAAKEMASQIHELADIAERKTDRASLQQISQLVRNIAANAEIIGAFTHHMSKHCSDKAIREELLMCSEQVPTISTQLKMVVTVSENVAQQLSSDHALVKTSENLIRVVVRALKASESACIKSDFGMNIDRRDPATNLAMEWKKKLYLQRNNDAVSAHVGAFGLRSVLRSVSPEPSLTDLVR